MAQVLAWVEPRFGHRPLLIYSSAEAAAVKRVQALGITQMRIGPQIDPGVPWCHAQSDAAPDGGLHLTLKSGNFGGDAIFCNAFAVLN